MIQGRRPTEKTRGFPGDFCENFRDFDENALKSYFIFCVFQTRSTLSAPRAPPTTSLAPLESLARAPFNGARLEFGGARGADFRLFENARKHAKSAKSYCFSFRKCTDKELT